MDYTVPTLPTPHPPNPFFFCPGHLQALLQAPGSFPEEQLPGPESPDHSTSGLGDFPCSMEIPLQPPPPLQRVMDPGIEQAKRKLKAYKPCAGVGPGQTG